MISRVAVFVLAILVFPAAVAMAQTPRVYVGATIDAATQTEPDTNPLGGTTIGGRALIGVEFSSHVSIEFESSVQRILFLDILVSAGAIAHALVGGLDVGIPVTSHVYLVPTLRMLLTFTGTASTGALESQTETGALMIRYGAGVRVAL